MDRFSRKLGIFRVVTILSLLTGCGIADHFNAQNKMEKSEQDYRNCLTANTGKPTVCEPLKEVWQADKESYESGNY